MESSERELSFLDILVYTESAKIHTDIYHKETDTFHYLEFNSCHPRHCKINIPFNLARRICTIVSDPARKEQRLNELAIRLEKRKYPKNLISAGVQRAKSLNTEVLRKPKEKAPTNDTIAFVSTYNPHHPDVFSYINTLKDTLKGSERMHNIIEPTKWIKGQRQPKNLGQILCRSKVLRNSSDSHPKVSKCRDVRCGTCAHIRETSTLDWKDDKLFQIKQEMNCTSTNLIYCIICAGCNEKYIGQTGDTLRNRVTVHRQQIKHKETRKLGMSEHISLCAKNKAPNFFIIPFYKLMTDNEDLRKNKEKYFIDRFKPSLNTLLV